MLNYLELYVIGGVPEPELTVLLEIYCEQWGSAIGSRKFPISRGVRQGDTLSSMLFNSVIEVVFRKWKNRIIGLGWHLREGYEYLTSIRYADDMLLFAKSLEDLIGMLSLLKEELSLIGLEMHAQKTIFLTNQKTNQISMVDVGNMFIEVLDITKSHKYLGRVLNLQPGSRIQMEMDHRIQLAWGKFHQHRRWLLNQHIPLTLRFKIFDAVITPCILFGLTVFACKEADFNRIEVVQRKMLRNIIGWRRVAGETWEPTMHYMKIRLERCTGTIPHRMLDTQIIEIRMGIRCRCCSQSQNAMENSATNGEP